MALFYPQINGEEIASIENNQENQNNICKIIQKWNCYVTCKFYCLFYLFLFYYLLFFLIFILLLFLFLIFLFIFFFNKIDSLIKSNCQDFCREIFESVGFELNLSEFSGNKNF